MHSDDPESEATSFKLRRRGKLSLVGAMTIKAQCVRNIYIRTSSCTRCIGLSTYVCIYIYKYYIYIYICIYICINTYIHIDICSLPRSICVRIRIRIRKCILAGIGLGMGTCLPYVLETLFECLINAGSPWYLFWDPTYGSSYACI